MVADMDDPERAFVFAEAAVAVGDVRGAIDALERVLTLNPQLTNIRFELGLLYIRAGSPDLAEAYLRDVVADPTAPDPVRARARDLIADGQAARARNRFTGSLSFGVRHETNANAAPDGILVGGLPFDISEEDASQADWAAVSSVLLRHSHDLGGQFGPYLETDLSAYGAAYSEVSASDVAFLRVTTGSRFRFGREGEHSVRPYAGFSTLALGQEHYRDTAILGGEAALALDARTLLSAVVETRSQTLHASDVNPTALNFEGHQHSASLELQRALGDRLSVDAVISTAVADLSADFESNTTWGLDLGLRWAVANPVGSELDPAILRLYAGYARAEYEAPNPQVDPTRTQADDRWRVGVGGRVPVTDRLLLDVAVDYASNESNLPNDSYDNLQVFVGLRYNIQVSR